MRTEENEVGGTSVILVAGDKLSKVPQSHRKLITPQMREVFADPVAHFMIVAEKCPFRAMAAWIRALVDQGEWELVLHQGYPELSAAAIRWLSYEVCSGEITPAHGEPSLDLPPPLRQYYSLVDEVNSHHSWKDSQGKGEWLERGSWRHNLLL